MYEALNSGGVGEALEYIDPAVEFHDLPDLPGAGVFHGHDELRGWFDAVRESFDEIRYEPLRLTVAGEAILVPSRATGTGRGSGALVEMNFVSVWWFRDGLAIRHEAFMDEETARAALER